MPCIAGGGAISGMTEFPLVGTGSASFAVGTCAERGYEEPEGIWG
jgi:hypothetical protein